MESANQLEFCLMWQEEQYMLEYLRVSTIRWLPRTRLQPQPCITLHLFLLGNHNEQHQHDNQHDNHRQTPILSRLPAEAVQPPARPAELGLVTINALLDLVQQQHLAVQLVPNLHAQLALPPDGGTQGVELIVLVTQHGAVVLVDLLVVEVRLVGRQLGILIAVRLVEQRRAVLGGVCVVVVPEAHALGRMARLGGGGSEVGGQGRVVGLGEGWRCGGGRGGRELGGEVAELGAQARQLRRDGSGRVG